jgi:hypothetical protein
MLMDKDTLYRLYVLEQMTTPEIAVIAGVSSSQTISNWLRKHGIQIRHCRDAQKPITPPYDMLYRLYIIEQQSIDAISSLLGSSEISISHLLDAYQIPKRANTAKFGGWNKGRSLSGEQKQFLSEKAKQRKGDKSSRYGAILSQETRTRIAKSLQGRFRGAENPQWKGERAAKRRDIWYSRFEYKQWRQAVFARDNYACQWCGKVSTGNIQAHHILTWAQHPEARFLVENGITLCVPCHRSTKGKEMEYAAQFQAIILHRSTP